MASRPAVDQGNHDIDLVQHLGLRSADQVLNLAAEIFPMSRCRIARAWYWTMCSPTDRLLIVILDDKRPGSVGWASKADAPLYASDKGAGRRRLLKPLRRSRT